MIVKAASINERRIIEQTFILGQEQSKIELLSSIPTRLSSDTAVLTVHGQWCNADTSKILMKENSKNQLATFALSLNGQGKTPLRGIQLSFDSAEADVLSAIEHIKSLGFTKIVLFGHSSGGLVACKVIANNCIPEVNSLILANSIPPEGSLSANINFVRRVKLGSLEPYILKGGRISDQSSRAVLYNCSGLPENFICDNASHLINIGALQGLTNEQKQAIKNKCEKILVIRSKEDRLFPNKDDFSPIGDKISEVLLLNADHMAPFTTHSKIVSSFIRRFLNNYF